MKQLTNNLFKLTASVSAWTEYKSRLLQNAMLKIKSAPNVFCYLPRFDPDPVSLSFHLYPKNLETTVICTIECSHHFFFWKGKYFNLMRCSFSLLRCWFWKCVPPSYIVQIIWNLLLCHLPAAISSIQSFNRSASIVCNWWRLFFFIVSFNFFTLMLTMADLFLPTIMNSDSCGNNV